MTDHRFHRNETRFAFWFFDVLPLALLAMLALGALVSTLAGCPGMPKPDDCPPLATRCHEDTPQVCSPGQRWTPADVRCGTVGAVCTIADGGAPSCLPGGAP